MNERTNEHYFKDGRKEVGKQLYIFYIALLEMENIF